MRGRGIDFEHRFRTTRWAEDLLIKALGGSLGLKTVRFGLSQVRPESELIYDVEGAKEPDLLVFRLADVTAAECSLLDRTDLAAEPRPSFRRGGRFAFALEKPLAALEVEFSPYRAAEMKGRHWVPRTAEQWQRRPLKHPNPPVAPNVFVKEEDLVRLSAWERECDVPIIVVHIFDQESFAIRLKQIIQFDDMFRKRPGDRVRLQATTGIFKVEQSYDRIDAQGAREKKTVFRVAPAAAVKAGDVRGVKVTTQLGVSSSKKYVSQVLFSGGALDVSQEFLKLLDSIRND